jgi:uncharacterized membrane protein
VAEETQGAADAGGFDVAAGPGLARVTGFSDGVFAIAITLLVLEVHEGSGPRLVDRLLSGWPYYLAFALSFLVIGLMWLNHHRLLRHATRLSTAGMLANLALLAAVCFLPFPTAVLAEDVWTPGGDGTTAAAFYALACLCVSGSFFLLTEVIRRDESQHRSVGTKRHLGRLQLRGWYAPLAYACAFAVAFVSPQAAMVLFVGTPFLFVSEPTNE